MSQQNSEPTNNVRQEMMADSLQATTNKNNSTDVIQEIFCLESMFSAYVG